MDSAGMMMYMGKNFTGGPQFLSGLEDTNITNPSEKDALCYDATNEVWINKSGVLREIVQKTQAQYDALTSEEKHDPTKIYEITDAQTISADIDDSSVSVGKTWSSSKINSNIADSGWINLTTGINYRKVGHLVTIRCSVTGLQAGVFTQIGTLPSGYIPIYEYAAYGLDGTNNACTLSIDTQGKVYARPASSTSCIGTFSFYNN